MAEKSQRHLPKNASISHVYLRNTVRSHLPVYAGSEPMNKQVEYYTAIHMDGLSDLKRGFMILTINSEQKLPTILNFMNIIPVRFYQIIETPTNKSTKFLYCNVYGKKMLCYKSNRAFFCEIVFIFLYFLQLQA